MSRNVFYTRKGLPWHGSFATDVSDCVTAQEVMHKANLDFMVEKCELVACMPFSLHKDNVINEADGDFIHDGNIYRECPNAYATYRTDLNIPLGLVKDKYEVVQNTEVFNFFDEAIGVDKAVWQTAGCYGYGHRVFISAKLPVETDVDGDAINNYLVFSTSHDGSISIDVMFTAVRMFCFNCLNHAKKSADSHIRLRHTKSAKERLHRGAEVLRIACEYAEDAQTLYNSLYTAKMSESDVILYLAKLGLDDGEFYTLTNLNGKKPLDNIYNLLNLDYSTMKDADISTRKANVIRGMYDYYKNGIGQKQIEGTAWGAYNAVTGYFSNVANMEGIKRFDSLLFGSANSKMSDAFNEALVIAEAV